jgi:hypothetical protein
MSNLFIKMIDWSIELIDQLKWLINQCDRLIDWIIWLIYWFKVIEVIDWLYDKIIDQ